jgi:hypothetical protein
MIIGLRVPPKWLANPLWSTGTAVHRVRPRRGEMVEMLRPAEFVDHLEIVLPLLDRSH